MAKEAAKKAKRKAAGKGKKGGKSKKGGKKSMTLKPADAKAIQFDKTSKTDLTGVGPNPKVEIDGVEVDD